jgi:hypothetical protein
MTNIFGTDHEHTTTPLSGGVQHKFKFENGYGASVVRHSFSYGNEVGLWELAVLDGLGLTYDTPITSDVVGRQTEAQIGDLLRAIEALPKAGA